MNENNNFYSSYPSFMDFVKTHKDVPFRYWVYKRVFTPYEQDHRFIDESCFEDVCCRTAYIRECIVLPDDDILIGFLDLDFASDEKKLYEYYKLSEIRLNRSDGDIVDE